MRSGKYIEQLSGDLRYKAFVPNPLPFELRSDDVLNSLLSRSNLALGRLEGISETLPDVDFFLLMYVRKEATLSSNIEGTQATFTDVLKAESKIRDDEIHNDVDEVINYISAMNYGLKRLKELPLSLRLIKELHGKLLTGARGEHKSPGEFRGSQNWIGGASILTAAYVPPPVNEMNKLMYNLEMYLHDKSPVPILIKAGLMHLQFEAIHPFLDGNGRIGRLLINIYLTQQGLLRKPLLYLSEYFKQFRQDYYDKLNAAHGSDQVEDWLRFFLEGIEITADKSVSSIQRIHTLKELNKQKIIKLGKSSYIGDRFHTALFRAPYVRIRDVERITGLSNPNAILLVRKFEDAGILKEITGRKRNKVYSYKEYIQLFEAGN